MFISSIKDAYPSYVDKALNHVLGKMRRESLIETPISIVATFSLSGVALVGLGVDFAILRTALTTYAEDEFAANLFAGSSLVGVALLMFLGSRWPRFHAWLIRVAFLALCMVIAGVGIMLGAIVSDLMPQIGTPSIADQICEMTDTCADSAPAAWHAWPLIVLLGEIARFLGGDFVRIAFVGGMGSLFFVSTTVIHLSVGATAGLIRGITERLGTLRALREGLEQLRRNRAQHFLYAHYVEKLDGELRGSRDDFTDAISSAINEELRGHQSVVTARELRPNVDVFDPEFPIPIDGIPGDVLALDLNVIKSKIEAVRAAATPEVVSEALLALEELGEPK